jgi:hypothetical protein
MVEIQISLRQASSTVLAGVSITHENVAAAEPNGPMGARAENLEQDNAGKQNGPIDQANGGAVFGDGQGGPLVKIVELKLLVYRLCGTPIKQRESSPGRRDVDRHINSIENQNRGVNHSVSPIAP